MTKLKYRMPGAQPGGALIIADSRLVVDAAGCIMVPASLWGHPHLARLEQAGRVILVAETPSTASLPGLLNAEEPPLDIPEALVAAGFDTVAALEAATDAELLAVSGIGKATVAKLREALG